MTRSGRAVAPLALVTFATALVCGGASRADSWTPTLVRLAALPLLAVVLCRSMEWPAQAGRLPVLFLAALALVAILQLVPLPPAFWSRLPGRASIATDYRRLGISLPWLPISLSPDATENAGLSLIPPAAIGLAAIELGPRDRRRMLQLALGVALVSVLLEALQIAGGPQSPLRPYAITNRDAAVGFFANRNHEAAFLAAAIPIAWKTRRAREAGAALALMVLFLAGVAATRSRAGVVLAALALGLSGAMRIRSRRGSGRMAWIAGAALLGIALLALIAWPPLTARFAAEPLLARWSLTPLFLRIGEVYAPVGAGLGSFESVYRIYEPVELVGPAYLNHAHDDYAELWIEAGWFGVAILAVFLAWAGRRGWLAWRSSEPWAVEARVGSVIVLLLLLHSLGDYPLRTPALACLFALACGLMIPPPGDASSERA